MGDRATRALGAGFPRAKVKATGWTIDPNLLIEIDNEVTAAGWETCMEVVEVVMLSAERRLLGGTDSPKGDKGE